MMPIRQQNPFSFYDFLGYLIPGALFLYLIKWFSWLYGNGDLKNLDLTPEGLWEFENPQIYIPFVLMSYVVGHLIGYLSSITIEKFHIDLHGYPSSYLLEENPDFCNYKKYFSSKKFWFRGVFVFIFAAPVSFLEVLFGWVFGLKSFYARPTDKFIASLFKWKAEDLFSMYRNKYGAYVSNWYNREFFRVIYHYTLEKSTSHAQKMQNYVAIYGFLRNMSFSSIILFWFSFFYLVFVNFEEGSNYIAVSLAGLSLVCFVFYVAFVKFFRRFSLEVIMAFLATNNNLEFCEVDKG
jgi:hypothetical protein